MPMSILIVLHDFSLGGTERIGVRLASAWAKLGHSVVIFCGNEEGPLKFLAGPNVRIVCARPVIKRGFGSRAALARAAARFLKHNPTDACFIPGNYHWTIVPALAGVARRQGGIVVAQISADLRKPQRGPLRQSLFDLRMRLLLKRSDGLVAMSEEAAADAQQVLPNRIAVIPLPALEDDPPPISEAPAGPPVVLGAGRLVPEKGFSTLIDAFALIPIEGASLVIAGSGPEEARLKELARQKGIGEKVTFLGYVEDIRPALDASHLFVLPSRFEGFGAVVIEALGAGRPVVMTNCSPAAALLSASSSGLVVPVDDVQALAKAMTTMLVSKDHHPNRAAALVSRHRIGAVAPQYVDFFKSLRGEGAAS